MWRSKGVEAGKVVGRWVAVVVFFKKIFRCSVRKRSKSEGLDTVCGTGTVRHHCTHVAIARVLGDEIEFVFVNLGVDGAAVGGVEGDVTEVALIDADRVVWAGEAYGGSCGGGAASAGYPPGAVRCSTPGCVYAGEMGHGPVSGVSARRRLGRGLWRWSWGSAPSGRLLGAGWP